MHTPLPVSPLYALAIQYLDEHQGEHLTPDIHLLVNRCAHHLLNHGAASLAQGKEIALQATGEISSRGSRAFIDLDHTTSYALFVSAHDGSKACFTLSEVLRALENANPTGSI